MSGCFVLITLNKLLFPDQSCLPFATLPLSKTGYCICGCYRISSVSLYGARLISSRFEDDSTFPFSNNYLTLLIQFNLTAHDHINTQAWSTTEVTPEQDPLLQLILNLDRTPHPGISPTSKCARESPPSTAAAARTNATNIATVSYASLSQPRLLAVIHTSRGPLIANPSASITVTQTRTIVWIGCMAGATRSCTRKKKRLVNSGWSEIENRGGWQRYVLFLAHEKSTSVVVGDAELTLLQGMDMDFDDEFPFAST